MLVSCVADLVGGTRVGPAACAGVAFGCWLCGRGQVAPGVARAELRGVGCAGGGARLGPSHTQLHLSHSALFFKQMIVKVTTKALSSRGGEQQAPAPVWNL